MLVASVLPSGILSTTAATAGRGAPDGPGVQLPAESLTGGGGGIQTAPGIVHAGQMTAVHFLPAHAPGANVGILGGFIPQAGALPPQAGEVRILWIDRTGAAQVEIGWSSNPARAYRVEAADSLPATDWAPVGTVMAGDTTSTLTIAIESSPRFFRVQQLP
ncbi:MAG: hypothetical protein KDM81_13590 [Verrucomicrobiae bacterium]|nr:hypothetical protein [Verrucomicrobiae bacterium]